MRLRWTLSIGLLAFVCGQVTGALYVKRDQHAYKARSVGALLERVLLQAGPVPIETYSFIGTSEPFFRDVIDRLAPRCTRLMVPIFNNVVGRHVQSRQLVIVAGDDIDSIMTSLWQGFPHQTVRFFSSNNRDIYVILVLSDLRFVEVQKFYLLLFFFSTINFIVVAPPPIAQQPLILLATDFAEKLVLVPQELGLAALFAERFRAADIPPVQVSITDWSSRVSRNEQGVVVGSDWMVVRTILEHLRIRWNLTLRVYSPSLQENERINELLDEGEFDIYIDRGFLPDDRSVAHILPEMNGFCMVVPKSKPYEVLQHLLRPMQPPCWIALGALATVGSLLTRRYCRHNLLTAIIFGANLNAPRVSRAERIVLFSTVVLFFVLSEAYQAKLLSLMSARRYPPDPNTVAEFLRTDIMLELGETTASVLSVRSEFAGHLKHSSDFEFTFDGRRGYGALMLCSAAWVHLLQWTRDEFARHGRNVRPAVHIVGEKLLSMVSSYSFSRHFLLYHRFRRYLGWLFESGLVGRWESATDRRLQYEQRFHFYDSAIITFGDLTMIWALLGIGNALAVVVFLVELTLSALHRFGASLRVRRARRLFLE